MLRGRDLRAAATAPHRVRVEPHRVFARADQDLSAFRHLVCSLFKAYL
jgi:hypothetical protein